MLFPSIGGYVYVKNTKDIIKKIFFPIIPMVTIRFSCPIRLVPTYKLPAKERRLLGTFQPDSFKTERLVCVQTDGQIKNIFFMGSETSPSLRCKLLTDINIPSARV